LSLSQQIQNPGSLAGLLLRFGFSSQYWRKTMGGPNWKLEDGYKSVTLSLPTTPPTALKMDVPGVEEILKNLGEFRPP